MPIYTASLARSVRIYGTAEIEADTPEHAAELLRQWAETGDEDDESVWGEVTEEDYSTLHAETIVSLSLDGQAILEDVDLTEQTDQTIITAEELAALIAGMKQ